MGKTTNFWLKRIFRVSTLTTIASLIGVCIAIIQYVESNGGSFVAFLDGKEVTPPVETTVLVYLDKDSADLSQIGFLPKYTNPSKYSLQDILFTYKIESNRTNISYSDYFSVHRYPKSDQLNNIDKTLYAKTDMPEPFYSFIVKDKSSANIDIRATYKGVDDPFTYQANVLVRKLFAADHKKRLNKIFSDSYTLAKNNNLKIVDLYILTGESVETYKDVSVNMLLEGSGSAEAQQSVAETKTINQIATESEEFIQATKDSQGIPWYMYIVGGILVIISVIAFMTDVFIMIAFQGNIDDLPFIKNRTIAMISFLLTTFIYYLCLYYFQVTCLEPKQGFVAGLIISYIVVFGFWLLLFCTEKTQKKLGIGDDAGEFVFAAYLIVIGGPIYYLCKYILETVQF